MSDLVTRMQELAMIDDFPPDEVFEGNECDWCGVDIEHDMNWEMLDSYLWSTAIFGVGAVPMNKAIVHVIGVKGQDAVYINGYRDVWGDDEAVDKRLMMLVKSADHRDLPFYALYADIDWAAAQDGSWPFLLTDVMAPEDPLPAKRDNGCTVHE